MYGYNQICFQKKSLRAAIVAWAWMTGEWPDAVIDHINGDKRDDRWTNLRLATPAENNANKGMQKNNTSGFKGVVWLKNEGKWRAMLQRRRGEKGIYLGMFETAEEAHAAYVAEVRRVYGEFARV